MSGENFVPVSTLADLQSLDEDEVVRGYCEYSPDDPEPGPNRGQAYWHGWRNAAMDRGAIPTDDAAARLVREFLAAERASRAKMNA